MQFFVPTNERPEGVFTRNIVYRELLAEDGVVPAPPIELPPLPERAARPPTGDKNTRTADEASDDSTDTSESDDDSVVSSRHSEPVLNPLSTVVIPACRQRRERRRDRQPPAHEGPPSGA